MIEVVLSAAVLLAWADAPPLESSLDELARQYRMTVYAALRTDRAEFDRRQTAGRLVLDGYLESRRTEAERKAAADWFAAATAASRPGRLSPLPPLPPLPPFVGPSLPRLSPEDLPPRAPAVLSPAPPLPPEGMRRGPDHAAALRPQPASVPRRQTPPPGPADSLGLADRRFFDRPSHGATAARPALPRRAAASTGEEGTAAIDWPTAPALRRTHPADNFSAVPPPTAAVAAAPRQVTLKPPMAGEPEDVFAAPPAPRAPHPPPINLNELAAWIGGYNFALRAIEQDLAAEPLWNTAEIERRIDALAELAQRRVRIEWYLAVLAAQERERMAPLESPQHAIAALGRKIFEARQFVEGEHFAGGDAARQAELARLDRLSRRLVEAARRP